MYKVTKEEMDIMLAECRSMKIVGAERYRDANGAEIHAIGVFSLAI